MAGHPLIGYLVWLVLFGAVFAWEGLALARVTGVPALSDPGSWRARSPARRCCWDSRRRSSPPRPGWPNAAAAADPAPDRRGRNRAPLWPGVRASPVLPWGVTGQWAEHPGQMLAGAEPHLEGYHRNRQLACLQQLPGSTGDLPACAGDRSASTTAAPSTAAVPTRAANHAVRSSSTCSPKTTGGPGTRCPTERWLRTLTISSCDTRGPELMLLTAYLRHESSFAHGTCRHSSNLLPNKVSQPNTSPRRGRRH
jgi:hypothetical protein